MKHHWWKFDPRDPFWVGFRNVAEPFVLIPAVLLGIGFLVWFR